MCVDSNEEYQSILLSDNHSGLVFYWVYDFAEQLSLTNKLACGNQGYEYTCRRRRHLNLKISTILSFIFQPIIKTATRHPVVGFKHAQVCHNSHTGFFVTANDVLPKRGASAVLKIHGRYIAISCHRQGATIRPMICTPDEG